MHKGGGTNDYCLSAIDERILRLPIVVRDAINEALATLRKPVLSKVQSSQSETARLVAPALCKTERKREMCDTTRSE